MEEAERAAVDQAFAAWNAGDVDGLVAAFHPDCTIESYLAQSPEPYRGHDGVRQWERDVREAFGRFDVAVHEVTSAPAGILVLGEVELRGQASGVPLVQPAGFLITADAGFVVTLRAFPSHRDACDAGGIEPRG